jgi:hypothetical protein
VIAPGLHAELDIGSSPLLMVYVPRDNPAGRAIAHRLEPASGLVGLVAEARRSTKPWRVVYYEGNRSRNLVTFADRVYHAAARLVDNAATTAFAKWPASGLHAVGTFDLATRTLSISDEPELARWLGRSDGRVPPHDLQLTDGTWRSTR